MQRTEKLENHKFDKRIIHKNIEKQLVSRKEYESYLKSLPDDKANAELLEISDEDSDL